MRWLSIGIFAVPILLLSGCISFQIIDQPSLGAPNEIFSVAISVHTEAGAEAPYFGVCLPLGWGVPGDSMQCTGVYTEAIYYDSLVSVWQEEASPAPGGYYWWAGSGVSVSTNAGYVTGELQVQTDAQTGLFSIDYMLGESRNGVNQERSDGHLIEITDEPVLVSVVPDVGYQNYTMDITIQGFNTHFLDGSGTQGVWLSQDSNTIHASDFSASTNTSLQANLTIPPRALLGLWDVNVETDIDGVVIQIEGFEVLPPIPVILVSSDSLYIELPYGSVKTENLIITNTGWNDLLFDIPGASGSPQDYVHYALQYNGFDSYVECADDSSLNIEQSLTVEAWIHPFDWDGNRRILQKERHDDQYRFLAENDVFKFEIRDVDNGLIATYLPSLNEWHHVAGIYDYDGNAMFIYVDGQRVAGKKNVTGLINTSADPLFIGTKNPEAIAGDFFHGIMDEIRIWTLARNETELKQYMHVELTGAEEGLAGYWKFNEGAGETTFDGSPNGNHGSLHGGVSWIQSSAPLAPIPGWISVSPDSGICYPDSSLEITVTFVATELPIGDYRASLLINSNDPFNPQVIVPIDVLVTETLVPAIVISADVVGDQLQLSWAPTMWATELWIYGAVNLPWFIPGFSPGYESRLAVLPSTSTTWASEAGVGDPDASWTYMVIAMDPSEQELARSNRAGIHDFKVGIP